MRQHVGVQAAITEPSLAPEVDSSRAWPAVEPARVDWKSKIATCGITAARRNEVARRALDITVALIAVVVVLVFLPVIVLAIRLDSKGPILFRQERVGRDGTIFHVYKFRSMRYSPRPDDFIHQEASARWMAGERLTPALDTSEPDQSNLRRPRPLTLPKSRRARRPAPYKLADDPRITRVGRFLRATSIDELPQFLNVLRGEMSVVGPRPPVTYEVTRYDSQTFGRLLVKPGLTGLWQVRGRGHVTFARMVEMDLEYVAQSSFWGDLRLMVLTLPAVLLRHGAA